MFYSSIPNPKSQIRNGLFLNPLRIKPRFAFLQLRAARDGFAVAGEQEAVERLLDLRELDREADGVAGFACLASHVVLCAVAIGGERARHLAPFRHFQVQLAVATTL